MGFLAPAIPWIIKGGAALGGALLGKKAQSNAQQRSPEELAALSGAQGAAGALSRQGSMLTQAGMPAVGQATNYYQTLLRGNRGAMAQATAGPRAQITDVYRGADRGLERSGVRGAARDVASSELNRERASSIASLTTGVQPMAAAALGGLGSNLVGQGTSALSGGGSIYSSLLGQGMQNRQYARSEGEKASTGIGSFLFDILSGSLGKMGGGGGGLIPTSRTLPNSTTWMPGSGLVQPTQPWELELQRRGVMF